MARYIGPKTKIARKFNDPIFGPVKNLEKKGQTRKRKKSEYGEQLNAKQKAKFTYGILEKQFANLFHKAQQSKGITGEILLQLCEERLDNVTYRLGLGRTRAAARQLVTHRHITVNGNVVNIPSYSLKVGDIVAVREKSKSLEVVANSVAGHGANYPWLEFDAARLAGRVIAVPERDQIPENINEQSIVELYSK